MIQLIDFKDRPFDRIIQMALRDIDMEDLADAMQGWNDDERGIILRNMSKRAAGLLMDTVKENEGTVPNHRKESAAEYFLQKIQQHLRYYARDDNEAKELMQETLKRRETATKPDLPTIDLSDDESIINSFVELSKYVRKHGLLSLSGIEESVDHPILRKALQFAIDGWDQILYQTILERMCTEYLSKTRRRLDMILVGMESLTARDHPIGMEERLRAFQA